MTSITQQIFSPFNQSDISLLAVDFKHALASIGAPSFKAQCLGYEWQHDALWVYGRRYQGTTLELLSHQPFERLKSEESNTLAALIIYLRITVPEETNALIKNLIDYLYQRDSLYGLYEKGYQHLFCFEKSSDLKVSASCFHHLVNRIPVKNVEHRVLLQNAYTYLACCYWWNPDSYFQQEHTSDHRIKKITDLFLNAATLGSMRGLRYLGEFLLSALGHQELAKATLSELNTDTAQHGLDYFKLLNTINMINKSTDINRIEPSLIHQLVKDINLLLSKDSYLIDNETKLRLNLSSDILAILQQSQMPQEEINRIDNLARGQGFAKEVQNYYRYSMSDLSLRVINPSINGIQFFENKDEGGYLSGEQNRDILSLSEEALAIITRSPSTHNAFVQFLEHALDQPALISTTLRNLQQTPLSPQRNTLILPEVAPENYVDRDKGENAKMFLERVWGKYLKCFGASENMLFQDQLWKLDAKLMEGIKIYCRNRKLKVSEFIPPKKERIDKEVNNLLVDYREIERLASAKRRRQKTEKA